MVVREEEIEDLSLPTEHGSSQFLLQVLRQLLIVLTLGEVVTG